MEWVQLLITVITAVLSSSGLWAFLNEREKKKKAREDANSAESRMILGLAHDRILYLSREYIVRGYITMEEYDNLVNYLYGPYKELGGNGTAERAVSEVMKLPIKPT